MGAVTRSTARARYGDYCYLVDALAAYDGMTLTLKALANGIHYVSLYLFDDVTGTPEVSLDGRSFNSMSVIGGRDGGWVRYGVEVPAAQASGSTTLYVRLTTAEDFSIDAVSVEENNYPTTYIDGDQPGCKWSGLRHGSASTRSAQERSGGRERNLLDDYGIEVVEGTKRIGTPPIMHNLLGMSLLPGALHQGTKVLPREIELHLNYSAESWSDFHGKRSEVFALFDPNLTSGAQPIVIGYAGKGTNNKLYSSFYYNGGLEFGDFLSYDEVAPVRLLAPDPFWYADDQQTASLDYQDTLSADYGFRRYSGQWQRFGTGFNGAVRCFATDYQRGRLYMGGSFTTADGVTVNRICYWDGNTFVAMGAGVAGGNVLTIAIASNGDVWIGGAFTTVDGTASRNNVARWNVSTGTWTNFGTSGTGQVDTIAIDHAGLVYVGGEFTNWNASANSDYIVSYDGSTWAALSTGADGNVYALAVDANNNLILGGAFTTLGGTSITGAGKWNGSAFSSIGTVGGAIISIAPLAGSDIFLGRLSGTTHYIYNGSYLRSFTLAAAAVSSVYNGKILAVVGDASEQAVYGWNGFTSINLDAYINGSVKPTGIGANRITGDIFIGTGSATVAVGGITTVTNGGTAQAFPRLTVINGNTSGSCTVSWLENQSSDHTMYFDLDVQAGETVTLDLANSQKKLTSDWRGVITDNPLKNSDVVNWHLLRGANTVATFITGTVTSVVALLHWTPRYWSADGSA